MNYLQFLSRFLIVLIFIFGINNFIHAQKKDSIDRLSVKAYVVGKGTYEFRGAMPTDNNNYFVLITVTNTQDTATEFPIFDHSWSINNFTIDNEDIYFETYTSDVEGLNLINLAPHKSVIFKIILRAQKNIRNRDFKIGFHLPDIYSSPNQRKNKIDEKQQYWSNKLRLEYNGPEFSIEN